MSLRYSIIVPIYKVNEFFLRKCLDSILNQNYNNYELILVDDGSPDKCPNICDEYRKEDHRIKVIHKSNKGLVSARETGLEHAQGEYVCYIDADDWIDNDWLQRMNIIIEQYSPDMICFDLYMSYENKEVKVTSNYPEGLYEGKELEDIYFKMIYNNDKSFYTFGIYPSVWSKIYKLNLIKECRCMDYEITMGEDAACVYKSLLEAKNVYIINKSFYHYRQVATSMTNSYDGYRSEKYIRLLDYLSKSLPINKYNIDIQIKYYKAFLVKHLVDNQSRAPLTFYDKVKELREILYRNNWVCAFENLKIDNASILNRIFIYFYNKKRYGVLFIMCYFNSLLNKVIK